MKRLAADDIVLKVLGLLLLTAAALKGHELVTVPVANRDLWSWRPFLIFQVEFERAMTTRLPAILFRSCDFKKGGGSYDCVEENQAGGYLLESSVKRRIYHEEQRM